MTKTRTRIKENDDGSVSLKIDVPRGVWIMCNQMGKAWGIKTPQVFRMMLSNLSVHMGSGSPAIKELLGLGWEVEYKKMQLNERVLAGGEKINYAVLHSSTRNKSGYEGVYTNGAGFRAMGKDPITGTAITIGTYERSEEAAWFRYKFFLENDIPYGLFAEACDTLRRGSVGKADDEMVRRLAAEHLFTHDQPIDHVPLKYRKYYAFLGANIKNQEVEETPSQAPDAVMDQVVANLHRNAKARAAVKEAQEAQAEEEAAIRKDAEVKALREAAKPVAPKKLAPGTFDPNNIPKFELDYDEWAKTQRQEWSATAPIVEDNEEDPRITKAMENGKGMTRGDT